MTVTIPIAAGELTVNWDELDNLTGYKVQWRDPDEDEVASWEDFDPIEDEDAETEDNQQTVVETDGEIPTTYPIPGLSAENTYAVRVIATNEPDPASPPNTDESDGGDGTPSDDATGRPRPGHVTLVT